MRNEEEEKEKNATVITTKERKLKALQKQWLLSESNHSPDIIHETKPILGCERFFRRFDSHTHTHNVIAYISGSFDSPFVIYPLQFLRRSLSISENLDIALCLSVYLSRVSDFMENRNGCIYRLVRGAWLLVACWWCLNRMTQVIWNEYEEKKSKKKETKLQLSMCDMRATIDYYLIESLPVCHLVLEFVNRFSVS